MGAHWKIILYMYIYISYNIDIFDRSALVSSPFLLQPLFLLFFFCAAAVCLLLQSLVRVE